MKSSQSQIPSSDLVDEAVFRNVAGYFATGVTVITTTCDDTPAGTTASAVASLSMDPPMMLVCLNRSSATHDKVMDSGIFAVNIMSQEQDSTALAFARKGTDKFAGISWSSAPNGAPVIDGSLATIACRVTETAVGGTHTVFMGEVIDTVTNPGEPLTYYRGIFGRFEHDAVERAYQDLRQHILRRQTPVRHILDAAALAERLRTRSEYVHQAMVRLESEGLVHRSADGSTSVAAITPEIAHGFFAAQAAIEVGVIDTYLPHAGADQLKTLQEARQTLVLALDGDNGLDLDGYIEAVRVFHRRLIGLSPSSQLLGAYEEMSTAALWSQLLSQDEWTQMLDHKNLLMLANAAVAQDSQGARAAVRRHLETVTEIATRAITAHGGSI
ncbi:flavin reductase [Glutamicibacter sp. MNS18]|uniref:flavin reductase n=1 Tax=Glutamicibacter sp. MNS18 TaxID=2989817 RepID=UPI00223635F7|nr:flavin reductase [Glutamicibacter sp. MNS18]MCW4466941.1 flavin reductase [Glutamicibacter sp. MNS18]